MGNTWISVKIVNYGMNNSMNYGHIYVACGSGFELYNRLSYAEAVKAMAKLAKALHRSPKMTNNWYGRDISYRELAGYVDQE